MIDAAGKTIMPGLVDMHGHIDCCYRTGVMPQKQPARYAAMAFGVTTNLDPYSSELPNYETRETDLAGITVGPRWIGSGSPIYGRAKKTDFNYVPLREYEDAHKALLRKQALGDMFIKSYKQPGRQQRQMLVKAGRETGIMVDVEGEGHFYNSISMVLDGHSNVEHNMPVANYYDDVIQLMSHGTSSNTPTLIVSFGELYGENFLYAKERAWEDPKVKAFAQEVTSTYGALEVPSGAPAYARNMTSIHLADELWDIGFRSVSRSVKKLDEAGGAHQCRFARRDRRAGDALGDAAARARRHEQSPHPARGDVERRDDVGFRQTAGLARSRQARRPDRARSQSPGGYSQQQFGPLHRAQRPALRLRDHERDRQPSKARTRFYWELDDYKGIDWNSAWSGQ